MAKRDVHLKFTIGNKFVTVEGGSGYIADAQDPMFDTVNVVIRGKNASGGVGPIEDRSLYIQRDQILAIGLNFLGLASQMTPRTMWARSGTVGCSHKEPTIYHLVEEDRRELLAFLEGTGSLPFGVQLVAVPPEEIAALMAEGKTKH